MVFCMRCCKLDIRSFQTSNWTAFWASIWPVKLIVEMAAWPWGGCFSSPWWNSLRWPIVNEAASGFSLRYMICFAILWSPTKSCRPWLTPSFVEIARFNAFCPSRHYPKTHETNNPSDLHVPFCWIHLQLWGPCLVLAAIAHRDRSRKGWTDPPTPRTDQSSISAGIDPLILASS